MSRAASAAASSFRIAGQNFLQQRERDPRTFGYATTQVAKQPATATIPQPQRGIVVNPPTPATIKALRAPIPSLPSNPTAKVKANSRALPPALPPTGLVGTVLSPPPPPQSLMQQVQSTIEVNIWRTVNRTKANLLYFTLLHNKQYIHQRKLTEKYGIDNEAGPGLKLTADVIEQYIPQTPSGLLSSVFAAGDLPEIRGLQSDNSILDNLFVHVGEMVGEIVSSLIDESVAAEKATEDNGDRFLTTMSSSRLVLAKYLQECVSFSSSSWRKLSDAETQAFVEKMQQIDPSKDWDRLSKEEPPEFSQALYYRLKMENKITEAHSLFAAANTLQTEAANQWRDTIFKLIKGTNLTLSRKKAAGASAGASTGASAGASAGASTAAAVDDCGPNKLSVSRQPVQSEPSPSSSHFGDNTRGPIRPRMVDIQCSIVSLDSVMARGPRTRRHVMPFAVNHDLYDQLVDPSSFPHEDFRAPRDIGLRIGPLERQDTDLCKVLNEFFVPIPIVLTHDYKVDTHEFGLFSGELARVINFYMHTPSEKVYALVQFNPTSDDLEFVSVDSSNYEPVELTAVEYKSELINSFGRVLHLNRSSKNPKDPSKLYKKYKLVLKRFIHA